MIDEAEFQEITGQMLEFLLPKHLAKDLKVTEAQVREWDKGKSIPQEPERSRLYEAMRVHPIWEHNG